MSIGSSDIWVGGGVDQGWVGTVLPKVLLRRMPSRLSPLVVAAVSAAAAAADDDDDDDDDDDGGGGGDDDDNDNVKKQQKTRTLTPTIAQHYTGLRNSALQAWKAGDEPRRTSHHASHGVEAGPNGRCTSSFTKQGTTLPCCRQSVSQSVSQSVTHSVRDQISCVLHHQLNGKILRAICAGPVL